MACAVVLCLRRDPATTGLGRSGKGQGIDRVTRGNRLLLLTTDDPARAAGGRERLSRLLHRELEGLFGAVDTRRLTGRTTALSGARGMLNGLNPRLIAATVADIRAQGHRTVLLDGSNLGAAARGIARALPDVSIVTYFHNCETRFFADAVRAGPGLRAMAVLAGHWRAERMALCWSTLRIALSTRDSAELACRFGRGADAVLPLAMADDWQAGAAPEPRAAGHALFVGGGFFGNLGALEWYARRVAPLLQGRTVVVGRGLERLAGRLPGNMELIGAVDDLAPWYAGAATVVAPILAGSGMKTKVAEALMHGKQVVGTTEAFSGYGAEVLAANCRIDDPAAMADAINRRLAAPPPAFDPAQRALYERFHSPAALRAGLRAILSGADRG